MKKMALTFALCIAAPLAQAAETGFCERKPYLDEQGRMTTWAVIDCAIPDSTVPQKVQISRTLSATYTSYTTATSSGILVKFFSSGQVLRVVDLSYNEADSETDAKQTVDLRQKVPVGAPVIALEFSGGDQSVMLNVAYKNAGNGISKVNVFGAN